MIETTAGVMTRAIYLTLRVSGIKRNEIFKNHFNSKHTVFHAFLKSVELFDLATELTLVSELQKKANIKPESSREREIKKEEVKMPRKEANPHITKELLDIEFSSGKTVTQIERDNGMSLGTLRSKMKTIKYTMPGAKGKEPVEEKAQKPANEQRNEVETHLQEQATELVNADANAQVEAVIQNVEDSPVEEKVVQEAAIDAEKIEGHADVMDTPDKELSLKDEPSNPLIRGETANPYITIHLRVRGHAMNRFEQRMKLTEDANEFITGVEVINLDFPRCASELFALIQAFAYQVEAELQGLMPKGNVAEKVVEFFEYHNELHLEKISAL